MSLKTDRPPEGTAHGDLAFLKNLVREVVAAPWVVVGHMNNVPPLALAGGPAKVRGKHRRAFHQGRAPGRRNQVLPWKNKLEKIKLEKRN